MEYLNDFAWDLNLILRSLNMSESALAKKLGFNTPSISNWLKGKYEADDRSKEDIYRYAYRNDLKINEAHEEPYRKLCEKQGQILLFHGAKRKIDSQIDLSYSKINNDFGRGFYCGEYYRQASMFISNFKESMVYAYGIIPKGLKKAEYSINSDWVLTIAYYRGFLNEYSDHRIIKDLKKRVEKADLIIAPIADNRMFDVIREFTDGRISLEACEEALVALDLGRQYVLRSEKAISRLGYLKKFYLCEDEKEYHQIIAKQSFAKRMEQIKGFRSRNKNGRYIEEILT